MVFVLLAFCARSLRGSSYYLIAYFVLTSNIFEIQDLTNVVQLFKNKSLFAEQFIALDDFLILCSVYIYIYKASVYKEMLVFLFWF